MCGMATSIGGAAVETSTEKLAGALLTRGLGRGAHGLTLVRKLMLGSELMSFLLEVMHRWHREEVLTGTRAKISENRPKQCAPHCGFASRD